MGNVQGGRRTLVVLRLGIMNRAVKQLRVAGVMELVRDQFFDLLERTDRPNLCVTAADF